MMLRTGVIARKKGMLSFFDVVKNMRYPATVLCLESCQVLGHRTKEKHGYDALILGCGSKKRVSKPLKGFYDKVSLPYKDCVYEFLVSSENFIEIGSTMSSGHFVVGQCVDVCGETKGKGFAGGMKRYGFGGQGASHGTSISHRSLGSTGQCQDPGRVFKGKKMAGHMGSVNRTQQNLEVLSVDLERNLIFVKGSVPSSDGEWVMVYDSVKKPLHEDLPFPGRCINNV